VSGLVAAAATSAVLLGAKRLDWDRIGYATEKMPNWRGRHLEAD
jgi:hypothetical protein